MQGVKLAYVTTVAQTLRFLGGYGVELTRAGCTVMAVANGDEHLDHVCRQEGMLGMRLPMQRRIAPLSDLRAIAKLVGVFLHWKPQIVHAHTPKGGLVGMLAAWIAGVPIRIYHIHGLPLETARGLSSWLLWFSERATVAAATQILCVSSSAADAVARAGIATRDRITVPANGSIAGVDSAVRFNPDTLPQARAEEVRRRFGIPDGAVVLGYVGRLVRDKGIPELVEAWQEVRREHEAVHLLVVGMFESRDPVPADVRKTLEGDPRIHLVGEDWSPTAYYAAMDIVVLPSLREGFPTVPLEAAAMKKPVVATRVTGCVDAVLDEVTGLLVPPQDSRALTAAIKRYLSSPALRAAHGRAARDRVIRDFQPECVRRATCAEYTRLLNREYGLSAVVKTEEQGCPTTQRRAA